MKLSKYKSPFTYWILEHKLPSIFLVTHPRAVAILPWLILVNRKYTELTPKLHRHELTHLYQWRDLWYIGFLPVYLFFVWGSASKIYANNPFEEECSVTQHDEAYLLDRPKNAWKKFIKKYKKIT